MKVRYIQRNKPRRLPISGCVNTTVYMHHMNDDKTYRENGRQERYKNATSYIEQIPEGTPTKQRLYGHLESISKTIQVRRTRHAGHCLGSKDELIIDVLQRSPSNGRSSLGRPTRTYLQQLFAAQDVVWKTCRERWMIGTDGGREREKKREGGEIVKVTWVIRLI